MMLLILHIFICTCSFLQSKQWVRKVIILGSGWLRRSRFLPLKAKSPIHRLWSYHAFHMFVDASFVPARVSMQVCWVYWLVILCSLLSVFFQKWVAKFACEWDELWNPVCLFATSRYHFDFPIFFPHTVCLISLTVRFFHTFIEDTHGSTTAVEDTLGSFAGVVGSNFGDAAFRGQ